MLDYVVFEDTGETEVNGELTPGNQLETTKTLAVFKLTFRDLQASPEGQWTMEDVKVYELGDPTIPMESVLAIGTKRYRFTMLSDRDKDGGFSMYWAKKIGDNETSTQ
jgi:hypothetical protein